MPEELVEIYVAAGQAEANLVKSFLEANAIPVMAVQEGAGEAYRLNIGVLGEVRLFTTQEYAARTKALIRLMEQGELEEKNGTDPGADDSGSGNLSPQ